MMTRLWGSLVGLVVACQSSPALAQVFTPEDESFAGVSLRRIFGCVVDRFWTFGGGASGGTCSADDTLVASIIGYFNIGCLVFASIVATYTVYSLVADTANDGEVLGRSSDTKYTFLRSGLGIILALPVSNGFSVIQLLLVQLIVWSIGFGDSTWSYVAERFVTASARSLDAGNLDNVDGGLSLRGTVAQAFRARIEGHVCAIRLSEMGTVLQGGSSSGTSVNSTTTNGSASVSIHFRGGQYWDNSSSLCGNVYYKTATINVDDSGSDGVQEQVKAAIVGATGEAVNRALSVGLGQIDSEAQAIAQRIVSQQRDTASITNDVNVAFVRIISSIELEGQNTVNSFLPQVRQAVEKALDQSTNGGWMLAILYQRIIAEAYGAIDGVGTSLSYGSEAPDELSAYVGGWTSYWNSSTIAPIVDAYERDRVYLGTLDGTFASMADGSGVAGVGTDGSVALGIAGGEGPFELLLGFLRNFESGNGVGSEWRDPIPDIQRMGNYIGAAAIAVGAASFSVNIAEKIPILGRIVEVIGDVLDPIFYLLLGLAFLVGGIIPLLPLVYYMGAAINWIILVLEAMIAAPLFLLTYFFPARESNLVGASRQGIVLIVGVLMRPVLIVIGLIAGMVVMRIATDFSVLMFNVALGAIGQPTGWGTIGNMFLTVGIILLFCMSLLYFVVLGCSLITELGDAVMRWLDNNIGSLFNKNGLGDTVGAAVANPGRVQALGVGSSVGQSGRTAREVMKNSANQKRLTQS